MLYLTKEQFEKIKSKYSNLLIMDSDPTDAFDFVYDVLIAESDALKEQESHATNSIAKLEDAAYNVYDIGRSVDNGEFRED